MWTPTICEVHGHTKGGAAYGYTRMLGHHPLLATRADTGEVLHVRMRKGSANTARGAERFVNELAAGSPRRRGWRACPAGRLGFLVNQSDHRMPPAWDPVLHTVRQTTAVAAAIAAIDGDAWAEIDYPDGGVAQLAETTLAGERLVVRRSRLISRRPPYGPTGATTPLSPTAKEAPSGWTPIIAATP